MNPHQTQIVATDLEGTLSSGITWKGMRDFFIANGQQVDYRRFFWRKLPQLLLYRLGLGNERAFKVDWILGLLALARGYSREKLADLGDFVAAQQLWPMRRRLVVAEIEAHKANGRSVVIVSGLFQPMLDKVAEQLGAVGLGTPLLFDGDTFTGELAGPLNGGEQKVLRLHEAYDFEQLWAGYGDTAHDIAMLSLAADAVAVAPDPVLRETAVARGWRIIEAA